MKALIPIFTLCMLAACGQAVDDEDKEHYLENVGDYQDIAGEGYNNSNNDSMVPRYTSNGIKGCEGDADPAPQTWMEQ